MASCVAALKRHWGHDAFRPMQYEAMEAVLSGRDCFVRMATGGGKSVCYQVPGAMAPEGKFTIVVSPLVALMQDQVQGLNANGLPAVYLGSSQTDEEAQRRAMDGSTYRFVYVTPELVVQSDAFRERLVAEAERVWLVAIDEAHCVSTWGHDFRPAYAKLAEFRGDLLARRRDVPVMALTATASSQVQADVVSLLGLRSDHVSVATSVDRHNLAYSVLPAPSSSRGGQDLAETVRQMVPLVSEDASTIVYAGTIADVEAVAEALREAGVPCERYHASLPLEEKRETLVRFRNDDVRVVVATVAFGMGIDKPDVRRVLHYAPPDTVQDYYQQSGRAGRDGAPAQCVLWVHPSAWQKKMTREMAARRAAEGASAVVASAGAWRETRRYCEMGVCRRMLLAAAFGETLSSECGVCDVCTRPAGQARDRVDATRAARSLLLAAKACGGRYGATTVLQVAMGTIPQGDRRKWLRDVACFGSGRGEVTTTEQGQRLASALRVAGLVEDVAREGWEGRPSYLALSITEGGEEWLRESESAFWTAAEAASAAESGGGGGARPSRKRASSFASRPGESAPEDDERVDRLRAVRKRLASRDGVPPFMVLSDATMRGIVQSGATTLAALLSVRGVGERTVAKYGKDILAALAATGKA